jgi:hypothetical protein
MARLEALELRMSKKEEEGSGKKDGSVEVLEE